MTVEKKTRVAQGTGIAAIVLALAGAASNYYQAPVAETRAAAATDKGVRAVAPEVDLLIQRVDRLEDLVFRLEGRALESPPTSVPSYVLAEGGSEPDEEDHALLDVADTLPDEPVPGRSSSRST